MTDIIWTVGFLTICWWLFKLVIMIISLTVLDGKSQKVFKHWSEGE